MIIESNSFGKLLNIALRLCMYFYMVMSHFLVKQIKSSLKLFTSTYRIVNNFEHLSCRPLVSSNKNKTELVFHEVSIYVPTK